MMAGRSTGRFRPYSSLSVIWMKWCELREYKWNEYVTIAVNRNLSNCENSPEKKKVFRGYFRNCLNCDSLRWSHTHFIYLWSVAKKAASWTGFSFLVPATAHLALYTIDYATFSKTMKSPQSHLHQWRPVKITDVWSRWKWTDTWKCWRNFFKFYRCASQKSSKANSGLLSVWEFTCYPPPWFDWSDRSRRYTVTTGSQQRPPHEAG